MQIISKFLASWFSYCKQNHIRPATLIFSLMLITSLVIINLKFGSYINDFTNKSLLGIFKHFKIFFTLSANFLFIILIVLLCTKYSKYKIGGSKAKVEFSNLTWYSMIFTTGMGSGLVFNGVFEPISHYSNLVPYFRSMLVNKEYVALATTYFHWGLHPWSIYAAIALILAVHSYQLKLPMSYRSIFYFIFKDKIYGKLGDLVDAVVIVGTVTSIAAALSNGVKQMAAGITFVFPIFTNSLMPLYIFIVMFIITLISVCTGLKRGIKILSILNIILAIIFMIIIFAIGPTWHLTKAFYASVGVYLKSLVGLSFWTQEEGSWQINWTIMYWAWWFAWGPFVGSFIASISKGRSIREFVIGAVLIPSLGSLVWMAILGGTAIYQVENNLNPLLEDITLTATSSLFYMINGLVDSVTFKTILSLLAILLLLVFFITSADSASFAVTKMSITQGEGVRSINTFWVIVLFAFSYILVFVVKSKVVVNALQNLVIISSIPIIAITLLGIISLFISLRRYK